MKKVRFITLILIITILLTSVSAVFAIANFEVRILNETGRAFWMEFRGESETFRHYASIGRTTLTLPKGVYTYVYRACSQENSVYLKLKGNIIITLDCILEEETEEEANNIPTVALKILNETGRAFWIEFIGSAESESVWHQAIGGRSTIELPIGEYTYKYRACSLSHSEWIKLKKETTIEIDCGSTSKSGATGKVTDLLIHNSTDGYMYLYFTSKTTGDKYEYKIPTGKQKIEIPLGSYTYSFWGCGGSSMRGEVKVTNKNSLSDVWYCISY